MNAAYPRDAVALLLISAAFFSALQFAAAQTYPNRTVRIVDVFPPGGGTDVVGRVLAAMLSPARIPADIVTRLNAELQKGSRPIRRARAFRGGRRRAGHEFAGRTGRHPEKRNRQVVESHQ